MFDSKISTTHTIIIYLSEQNLKMNEHLEVYYAEPTLKGSPLLDPEWISYCVLAYFFASFLSSRQVTSGCCYTVSALDRWIGYKVEAMKTLINTVFRLCVFLNCQSFIQSVLNRQISCVN